MNGRDKERPKVLLLVAASENLGEVGGLGKIRIEARRVSAADDGSQRSLFVTRRQKLKDGEGR